MTTPLQSLPRSILAVLSVLASTGCATLTSGKMTDFQVDSTPPGAEVLVAGRPMGRTPVTIQVDKSKSTNVEVAMPGFGSQRCRTRTSVGAIYVAADLLLCAVAFPIGCISFIDAGGAWNQLEDNSCSVTLTPSNDFPAQAFSQQGYQHQGAFAPPAFAPNPVFATPAGYPAPGAPMSYPPPPPQM